MRILVLSLGVFDKGGVARYGRAQIAALRDGFGCDAVDVLSILGPQPGDFEEPFEVSWSGPAPRTRLSRFWFTAVALRFGLRRHLDVVVAQHLYLGPLALPLASLAGAGLVQTVYGKELWSPGLTGPRKWALRKADLVIADCHNSAIYCARTGLVPRQPEVIWDCVRLDRFKPGGVNQDALSRYGLPAKGRFRLLFLGRLGTDTRSKGADRLLRLAALLPAEEFETVLAGKGDDLARLKELAQQLGIANRTFFTGAVHEADLPDVYRSADVFYLTSEVGEGMGEGIPLTPIEALACGTPVIVGDRDGSRELLSGGGGLCCEPTNLTSQAQYVARLAADHDFRLEERRQARSRAEQAFGYDAFSVKTRAAILAACRRQLLPGRALDQG